MPVALILIGVAMVIVAFRGTQDQLGALLKADGPGFLKWAGAMVAIWLISLVPPFTTVGKYLLGLVLLVIVIANKGAFANLQQAFVNPPAATQAPAEPQGAAAGGGGGGGFFGNIIKSLTGAFGGGAAAAGGSAALGGTDVASAAATAAPYVLEALA